MKFKDLSDGEFKHRLEDRPILDPHLVIEYLFNKAKVAIPREEVRRYWNHHSHFGEKWAQSCDNFDRIPLGIFGDNARVTTQYGKVVQLIGIFMNLVLWRPGSVRLSRFLLFSIGDHELWGYHTLQTVYRRLTWSLNALWEGRHPEAGAWGDPLGPNLQKKAGKWITHDALLFATTEVRGDWSWLKKIFRFERTSWTGIQVCHHCRALSSGEWKDLYWNLEPSSNWYDNMFDLDDWCEERLPAQGICNFVKKVDLEFCFQKIDLKYVVSVSSNSFIQFYEHMLLVVLISRLIDI